ncbi:MAG: hypothetical protein CW338_10355, partial [Clostridiales bacterium]|nr:hypothetical protein [Clostridiales bacterium]
YISTHGVYNPEGDPAYMLVLSNGRYEYYLDCRDLRAMLDEIPGTKVLVFDACNSGYVIGKGGDLNAAAACFSGPDYKVITSSGCEENSFYWKTVASRFGSTGSSFFCSAFCDGIGINGSCPADADRDGRVTLGEMHRYLYDNYGAATPRVYPQNDDSFVLFVYDRTGEFWAEKPVSRIEFDSLTLTRQSPDITFSFAVTRPAQLYYQVVYYKNGAWDFQNAVYIGDSEGDDRLSPGIKRRTFSLSYDDAAQSGYILLQFFTLEEGQPRLQSSRILCAGGEDEQIGLSVSVPDTFCFSSGAEMSFSVDHAVPCSLTVSVKDSEGRTVVYLCTDAVTRPESPLNTLTYLCWDGRDRKGNPVAPGDYVICVRAESCDGVCESVVSTPVEITE